VVGRPDDPGRDHRVVPDSLGVEHLDRHDHAGAADTGDPDAVAGAGGDDPGDRRAVPLVVARGRGLVDEVVAGCEGALEIGLGRIDAGVDHGHDDLPRARDEVPGLGEAGQPEPPLLGPAGVVRVDAERGVEHLATGVGDRG
jgi:hypothetical protein